MAAKHFRIYTSYERRLRTHIMNEKISYYKRVLHRNSNQKSIWKVVDSFTGKLKERETIKVLLKNGHHIGNSKEIANELCAFFSTHPQTNSGQSYSGQDFVSCTLRLEEDVAADIIPMINEVKGKSIDEYGFNRNTVKQIIFNIIDPLSVLYSRCLTECVFPVCLKRAIVIPIHKKGDKTNSNNYRPISILPIFGKILEKLMKKQIMSFLEINHILDGRQHGYRTGKGSETAIQELIGHVATGLDNSQKVATLFLDLTKAFDRVDHDILLYKLHCYGLRGNIPKFWVESLLLLTNL